MASDPKKTADDITGGIDIDWQAIYDELVELTAPLAIASRREVLAALGRDDMFDQSDADAIAWAKQRAAELVGMRVLDDGSVVPNPNAEWSITESTRDMIRDKVISALEEGKSVNQVQTELIDETFGPQRALMIARTESATAHNSGQLDAAKSAGVGYKEWLVADAEVCDECEENEQVGRIAIDESFPSGDDAPVAHPNCRCSMSYFYEPAETEAE